MYLDFITCPQKCKDRYENLLRRSNAFKVKTEKGVRQRNHISPKRFFTLVMEEAFKEIDWEERELNICRKLLHQLRIADDIVLLGKTKEALCMMLDLRNASQKIGLDINFSKTKFLTNKVDAERNTRIKIVHN